MNKNLNAFISFNKTDNKISDEKVGWITEFKKNLGFVLQKLTGTSPVFSSSENKKEKLKQNEIIVSIVFISNNYLNSTECVNECKELTEIKNNQIFLVALYELKQLVLPDFITSFPRYEFFITNENTNTNTLLHPGDDFLYWFKIIDIAYDICNTLPEELVINKNLFKQNKGSVFLADTSNDQIIRRDMVKKELQMHGYHILPDKPLSSNLNEYKNDLIKYIKNAFLSIHIIGNEGKYLNSSEQSVIEIQNQIASDEITGDKTKKLLYRLIWMPPALDIKDEKHLHFVEQLKRDRKSLIGAEIIQTPIEEFKNIIQHKINDIVNPSGNISIEMDLGKSFIYIIHEKEDAKNCSTLIQQLAKKGLKIETTSYDDEEIKNLESHLGKLIKSEAIIIYYGIENEQWLHTKLKELMKVPGYGREKPFAAKILITKNDISSVNNNLLKGFEIINEVTEKSLKPLFDKITK